MNKYIITLLCLMLPLTSWCDDKKYDWGENFSWSIESTYGDKTYTNVTGLGIHGYIVEPDAGWIYKDEELDENGNPTVGPFLGICDAVILKDELIEVYLEWEDEDGNVFKDPLEIMAEENYLDLDGEEDYSVWYGNNERDGMPCVSLHRNCKNTIKIISKKSTEPITSLKFNFNPEYNGHPFYDDCPFMELLGDRTLIIYEYYIGSSFFRPFIIPGTYLTKDSFKDIVFEMEDYWDYVTFNPDKITRKGDYEIDVSLHDLIESHSYELWGTNLQFDLDGGGTVEFTPYDKETQTLSGAGLKEGFHTNNTIVDLNIRIFPNPGKQLASVKLIQDIGIDDEKTEILLNTEYNEELNYYEVVEGEGYPSYDNYLEIETGWMNTIVVKFKDEDLEPVTIDFTLNKPTEVNGHALYDDCMMLFDKMNVSVNVCRTVSDGDPSNPQYSTIIDETYTAEVPGAFTQDVDLYNRFIDIDCEGGLGDYAVYGFKPVASWDGIIEGTDNDVEISYEIPLTNQAGESNLPFIWGNNLQFDLDGNGEIQFNDETLSGTGLAGSYHNPDPESSSAPVFRIFANPGKTLGTLSLIYENGLDDKTVETALNTSYNEGLGCFELAPGDGYEIVDGMLVLNSGWMNTIVVRFKDAVPLELADDDSGKPVGERNSALIAAKDGVMTDVVLSGRTLFKDNSWNTLCLPFSLTEDEIAAGPLAGADIRMLNWGSVEKSIEYDNLWRVKLKFKNAPSIEAGKPYIIKWNSGDNITDPVFEDVTVDDTQSPVTVADGHVVFTGYYDAFTATPNDNPMIYYLTDNNKLKYTASNRLLKACRAYFTFTPGNGSGSAGVFSFDIDFGNGETGITTTLSPESEGSNHWYTLDGRRLSGKPTVKGIYINNGQKVVIK